MCRNKGGLKKRLKGTELDFVHPLCALMAKNIEVFLCAKNPKCKLEDAINMVFVAQGKSAQSLQSFGAPCDICKQPGAQAACEHKGCKK